IGTVDCARHNMKRPNGVGDLQRGEKYINMDWMLWMSLVGYDLLVQLIISYDIVCQWHINIWKRLQKYSPALIERAGKHYYMWLIPKFHLPAHIEACNILYSFNLTPFVGQTDGEAPERGWANANPLASSTKEMGPGSRRDVLDDHFNDWNHKKIVALGRTLLERVKKAVGEMVDKQRDLVESEASLPSETLEPWKKATEMWELDPTNPNPFNVAEKHDSLQAIRGRIAEETKNAVEGDLADDVRGDLHASEMIAMGMQLEQQQRALTADIGALKLHATDGQKTTMLERGNKLRRKIANWIATQTDFQPALASLRAAEDQARAKAARSQPTAGIPVHSISLWLPSKQMAHPGTAAKETHARYEFDMREANAHEALEEIRRLLLVRTHHYKFKDQNVEGVEAQTRARTSIQILDELIRRQVSDYKAARLALTRLAPLLHETHWQLILKELLQDDEAMREATNEALRVEWAKTRARAHRWTEEVDLLEEEMRRTLVFLDWKVSWWQGLQEGRPEQDDPILREGLNAYATRQADIFAEMKAGFEKAWADVPTWIAMGREGVAADREQGEGAAHYLLYLPVLLNNYTLLAETCATYLCRRHHKS
ncbi:hypothetical protein B0H15DRAFT_792741, partial [Mycena belliarum]